MQEKIEGHLKTREEEHEELEWILRYFVWIEHDTIFNYHHALSAKN